MIDKIKLKVPNDECIGGKTKLTKIKNEKLTISDKKNVNVSLHTNISFKNLLI